MKKIFALIIFSLLFGQHVKAQYAPIGDGLRTLLTEAYPSETAGIFDPGGLYIDTTATFVRTLRHMDLQVGNQNSPLNFGNALQYFRSLEYLNCSGNSIQYLGVLPASLDTLICANQLYAGFLHWTILSGLPALPAGLKYLDCSGNDITAISSLPAGLTYFDCSGQYYHSVNGNLVTELTQLPALPASLGYLSAGVSNTSFAQLPSSMTDLNLYAPNMPQLPALPPVLQTFHINDPLLNCLPSLPPTLQTLTIVAPLVTCIPNDVPGLAMSPALPVCSSGNNPNNCIGLSVFGAIPDVNGLITLPGVASTSSAYTLYGYNLSNASGDITVTASGFLEVSADNITFSSSAILIPYNNSQVSTQVYVRISATAPLGAVTGTITNSVAGSADAIINVNGNVTNPFLSAAPDINGINTFTGIASAVSVYAINGLGLVPASGNITITPSAGIEVSVDNINFSTVASLPYTNGRIDNESVYVRIRDNAPLGPISAVITNSGGGQPDVVVNINGTVNISGVVTGADITGLSTFVGVVSSPGTITWKAQHVLPPSGSVTITASAGLEIKNPMISGTYSTSFSDQYSSSNYSQTNVRISSTAPPGPINGTVTYSIAGYPDAVVNVSGYVFDPVIHAGPDINGLSTYFGTASTASSYTLSATGLNPASGNLSLSVSSGLEISTDNINFSAAISIPYTGNTVSAIPVYVRITAGAPLGAISGTVTNSGGGAADVIVNVSGSVIQPPPPLLLPVPDISGLSAIEGSPSASVSYTLSATNLVPANGNISITGTSFLEFSTDNVNFFSSLLVPYTGGQVLPTTIYLRIASGAAVGAFSGVVTNSGGGATDDFSVSGNVSQLPSPVITASPDISGLSSSGGNPSLAGSYTLSADNLVPASANINILASSLLEVSTDNVNFSSSLSIPYTGGQLNATIIYVRIMAGAPTGSISGTVTNSGGGAADAIIQVSGLSARPAAIAIGPNPSRNLTTIYLPGNTSAVVVNISNGRGQIVKTITTNKESVQAYLSDLSRGMYFIKIKGGEFNETRALLVE